MSTFITRGAVVISPTAVTTFESDRSSGVLVHAIPGRPNPDITIRPAGLQTGTLQLAFISSTAELDAKAAVDAHAAGGIFSLVSDNYSTLPPYYVPNGAIRRALDPTLAGWTVSIDFQEVAL